MDDTCLIFSIIVPVYNASKYLHRCIDSILAQKISEFELILVDDGSTDNSGEICDAYAMQNAKVKVFHQINQGVSIARNLGLEKAKGHWILFVDSDDWVEPLWLEILMKNIHEYSSDLYVYGIRRVTDKQDITEQTPSNGILSNKDFVASTNYNFAVWAYLFRSSVIKENNIQFPVGLKYSEDQAFLLKYISMCDVIIPIKKVLYNYYNYPNSTVSRNIYSFDWAMSNLIVANDFLHFCKLHNVPEGFYSYPVKRLYEAFLFYYHQTAKTNRCKEQREYRKAYRESLSFYPELKKQRTFKLAYMFFDLPKILSFRKYLKNKIKKT